MFSKERMSYTFPLSSLKMQIDHLWQSVQTTLFAAGDTSSAPAPYCSAIKIKVNKPAHHIQWRINNTKQYKSSI